MALALGLHTGSACLPRTWTHFLPSIPTTPHFAKSPFLRKPGGIIRATTTGPSSPGPINPPADGQDCETALTRALQRCAVCLATAAAIALPLLPLPSGFGAEVDFPSETATTLVETPIPAKDVGILLRDALPVHNVVIRDVQKSLEGIADCLKLEPEEAITSIALNTRKAALVLDQKKESILAEVVDHKKVLGQLLVDELTVGVTECNKLAEEKNLAAVAAKQINLLQIVSKLEEFMVTKFPFDVPEEYANKPLLKGRATIEMKVRLKERRNNNGNHNDINGNNDNNGSGNGKSTVVKIVVDGYNAPLTAGNFVDLVARRFYDGMAIQKADGFIVQTGDPPGTADGFVDPGTGKVRTIPLEIMVEGDSAPIYGATLEELGRDQDKTKLPFYSCSTLAMARKGKDKNSASSQIFWLLKDCPEEDSSTFEAAPAGINQPDSAAPKAVELKVRGPVDGYSSAIELTTTDPSVEDKLETVTKEINISKSILDGIATENKASSSVVIPEDAIAPPGEQLLPHDASSSEPGGEVVVQESEVVVKAEDLKDGRKEGRYAVFGYVVENSGVLAKLQVGDVIENMRVISGIDNLVNPSYRI